MAARFTQADVSRAISAAEKARLRSYRIDITPDGTISIVVGTASKGPARGNSCDDLLEPDAVRHNPLDRILKRE